MTWATDRRLDYIDLLLLTQGRVRREEIMAAFDITMSAASGDIGEFVELYPNAMLYDKSAKQYVPANGRYRSVRKGMEDPRRREALALLTQNVTATKTVNRSVNRSGRK